MEFHVTRANHLDAAIRFIASDLICMTNEFEPKKPHRNAAFYRSVRAMADTHSMMTVVFDVTHFVMTRCRNGNQRCGQRGAKHQGGQTGERLDNSFHGQILERYKGGSKCEPELYRRVRALSLPIYYRFVTSVALDVMRLTRPYRRPR
ncbi:hypothetical protein G3N59_10330 [Paraburkholderia sp. Ac-20340]|uniref:hypothetical protein n=1 Tax=Paraburkholderia sp. Ac-20340 TaxID=2703888 RepID=UPI0019812B3E|nr:hypothetical protein [Paraburkholderia sp. Ac-20340]MBN3853776.1 hypothetical protein [Paraburkholderia sp. Ac-20340]